MLSAQRCDNGAMPSAQITDQPAPVPNDRPAIADLVMADMAERKRMKPVEAAYLAGLLDGEGCIQVRQGKEGWTRAMLEVCMTTPEPLEWAHAVTGAGGLYERSDGRKNRRRVYKWIVSTVEDAAQILAEVLPYLQLKQGEARAFLVLAHLRRAKTRKLGPREHVDAERHIAGVIHALKALDGDTAYREALELGACLRQAIEEHALAQSVPPPEPAAAQQAAETPAEPDVDPGDPKPLTAESAGAELCVVCQHPATDHVSHHVRARLRQTGCMSCDCPRSKERVIKVAREAAVVVDSAS